MDNAQNIAQGVALPDYQTGRLAQSQVRPPRTFDSIKRAVSRVRASKAQVSEMLNRVSPRPNEDAANAINKAILGEPGYADALEQLDIALNELGQSLDELGKHI